MLAPGEQEVERRILKRDADQVADRGSLADDVVPADPRGARSGREQGGEHVHGRRLPGAVRAQKAVDLARADR